MARTWSDWQIGRYTPSEASVFLRKLADPTPSGGRHGIIAIHGRATDETMWMPGTTWGAHVQNLVDSRYFVISPNAAGPATWSQQASIDAITGAYNNLIAKGCTAKVGIIAHSMGVGGGLIWMKQNPTKVSAVYGFAGVTDLDWARTQSLFTAEINAAYGGSGSYAANSVGHKIADEFPTWRNLAPIRLAHGLSDPFVSPTISSNFVSGVNQSQVTYLPLTGQDHTSLFGAVPVTDTQAFFDAGSW